MLQKGGYGTKGNLQQPATDVHAREIHTHTDPTSFHLNVWIKGKRRNVETGSRDYADETEMC